MRGHYFVVMEDARFPIAVNFPQVKSRIISDLRRVVEETDSFNLEQHCMKKPFSSRKKVIL